MMGLRLKPWTPPNFKPDGTLSAWLSSCGAYRICRELNHFSLTASGKPVGSFASIMEAAAAAERHSREHR